MKKFPRFKGQLPPLKDFIFLIKIFSPSFRRFVLKEETTIKFSNYFEKPAIFTSSFRIGLFHVINVLKLAENSEAIIGPITIPDAISAIELNKLKPIFADLDLDSHTISLSTILKKISPNTKLIIITYLSGIVPDHGELLKIASYCKEHSIYLIEDITQAYGAKTDHLKLGTIGDFTIGSLSAGKTISTTFGGFILCPPNYVNELQKAIGLDEIEPPRLMYLYKHFYFFILNVITRGFIFEFFVFNFIKKLKNNSNQKPQPLALIEKLDPFNDEFLEKRRTRFPKIFHFQLRDWHFSMASYFLDKLDNVNYQRKNKATYFLNQLDSNIFTHLSKRVVAGHSVYYHFPIRVPEFLSTEMTRQLLLQRGIDSVGYGLNLCHREKIFKDLFSECPNADIIKNKVLFIPFHESYTSSELFEIAQAIKEIWTKKIS